MKEKEILNKYRKLVKLWKDLISLDDKNWKPSTWKMYLTRWNRIKKEAKKQLKNSELTEHDAEIIGHKIRARIRKRLEDYR